MPSTGEKRKEQERRKQVKRNLARPFIAVDGEGWTLPDNTHILTLLGASDGSYIESTTGLRSRESFDYLLDLAEEYPKAIFVGFSFSYDANMIFGSIPWEKIQELQKRGSMIVKLGATYYRIEYRRAKWLRISEATFVAGKYKSLRTVSVYDVFGFFQCGFVQAMLDMGVISEESEEYEELTAMKALRGDFTADMLDRMKAYNLMECELLVQAMDVLRAGMADIGLHPKGWHGAGAIAAALLDREGMKEHLIPPPEEAEVPVLSAYFGGRIDVHMLGDHTSGVYSHDINSAYPAALIDLPSLEGATWERAHESEFENPVSVWLVRWRVPNESPFGPFPFRTQERRILFPLSGEGWYWQPEVAAAMRAFPDSIEILGGLACRGIDHDSRPWAWIERLYHERRALKAEGKHAQQKAIKLGINSLYGKLAQGVGFDKKRPAYQNYIYAGLITAKTRAALLDVASQAPRSIVAFSTDGIYSTEPLAIEEGDELGQWERDRVDELFLIQPGFYRIRNEGKETYRTRGFRPSEVPWDKLRAEMAESDWFASVEIRPTRFIGLGAATVLGAPEQWRTWSDAPRMLRITSEKFDWFGHLDSWGDLPNPARCYPHRVPPNGETRSAVYIPKGEFKDPDMEYEIALSLEQPEYGEH